MTSTHSAGQTTTGNQPAGVYEVLVSCYDGMDFDGDWRYSAFCPDIDTAMDGRTPEEALLRVKEAIRVKLANYQAGQLAIVDAKARDEAVEDFLNDGRLVDKTTVLLDSE